MDLGLMFGKNLFKVGEQIVLERHERIIKVFHEVL